jgi:hypothetical protein
LKEGAASWRFCAFAATNDYYSLNEVERMRYGIVHLSFLRRAETVLFRSTSHVLTD